MAVASVLLLLLLLRASRCSVEQCGKVFEEIKNRVATAVQGPPGKVGAPGQVDYGKLREIIAYEQHQAIEGLRQEMREKFTENRHEIFAELESQKLSVLSKENEELRAELEEVKATLEARVKWKTIEGLRQEMGEKHEMLAGLSKENEELRAELKEVKATLETFKLNATEDLRQEMQEKHENFAELCRENEKLQAELEEMKGTLETRVEWKTIQGLRQEMREKLTENKNETNKENEELRAELKEVKATLETLVKWKSAQENKYPHDGAQEDRPCTTAKPRTRTKLLPPTTAKPTKRKPKPIPTTAKPAQRKPKPIPTTATPTQQKPKPKPTTATPTQQKPKPKPTTARPAKGRTTSKPVINREAQQGTRICEVRYNGICFFSVIHDTWDMNFAEAESICSRESARVADIYNKTHFEMVMELIRSKTHFYDTYIWTGLQVNPGTREVFLRNGDKAPFVKWPISGDYPKSNPSWKNLILRAYMNFEARNGFEIQPWINRFLRSGMENHAPDTKSQGVICQWGG